MGPHLRLDRDTSADDPVELFDGVTVEVAFVSAAANSQMRWHADCNQAGAYVTIAEKQLEVRRPHITHMLCEQPRADRDQWLFDFFTSDPRWNFDDGWLTLTSGEHTMRLRDPQSTRPVDDQTLDERAAGALDLALGHGSLWVAAPLNGGAVNQGVEYAEVLRVDATTGQLQAAIEVDHPVHELAVADSVVYTLSNAHGVGRIDPATNTFTSVPAPPGAGELAADANQVWLATAEVGPRLLLLDAESLEVRREERIDALAEIRDLAIQRGADGIRLVVAGGGHEGGGTVAWVDPDTWAYEAVSLPRPVNRIAGIDGGWWVTYAPVEEGGPGGVAFLARDADDQPVNMSQIAEDERAFAEISVMPDGDALVVAADGHAMRLQVPEEPDGTPQVVWEGDVGGEEPFVVQPTSDSAFWTATSREFLRLDFNDG